MSADKDEREGAISESVTGDARFSTPGYVNSSQALRAARWGGVVLVVLLMFALRVVALDSDPYAGLSWSSGLLTDEGFYIHNARNVALFGIARTDDFNNMLIMPTLHYVQVAVFSLFGPGIMQARSISVVCSLLAIAVLGAAARRAFGLRIALYATLFFGLDHIHLLYNRMALMDTPAMLVLVCALYAWVRGVSVDDASKADVRWLAATGVLLALAVATRGLSAFVLPAPFIAAWDYGRRGDAKSDETRSLQRWSKFSLTPNYRAWVTICAPLFIGLLAGFVVYAVWWYVPHRVELAQVNRYYLWRQLLPHTPQRLARNVLNAWFGDERGTAPFLMRHSPIQVYLALGWLALLGSRARIVSTPGEQRLQAEGPHGAFVLAWMGSAVLFLSVANYTPSRYYVLFYPALALMAAFALAHMSEVVQAVLGSKIWLALLGGYGTYHLALSLWHHATIASMVQVGVATLIGADVAVLLGWLVQATIFNARTTVRLTAVALACWGGINALYLGDWLTHLAYGQRDAGRWLASSLPSDAILIGDAAAGICFNNRLRVVPVITGLCNDRAPVERFSGHPRAVVILDGPLKEPRWIQFYPMVVAPERRARLFPNVAGFPVGVYIVEDKGGAR